MIKTANLTASISRNAGGLYESVRRLTQSLAATGMDVRVFGTEDEHTAEDIGLWSPVSAQAFRPVGPHQFGYSPQFRRALDEFAPDLVHTHGIWVYSSVVTNQYRHRRGVPYVISTHGMLDPWAIRHSRWKKVIAHFFYEGAHLREAGCLRALCEPEARAIRQLGLKNPIAIIPNGIDLPLEAASRERKAGSAEQGARLYEPQPSSKNEFQVSGFSVSAFAGGRKVLLYLGRIHPKKGLVNLLRAWASISQPPVSGLRSPVSDWTLAIAGWDQGGHEAELKQLCTELGISWADIREQKTESAKRKADFSVSAFQNFSVLFLGPQFNEAKAACYAQCDGFILPSFSEGVPMVVLEAWAYGKPVLMTPACNLPAGFARGAAIRIETDVDSIAHGLREFFQASDAQRQALGDQGLRLAREQFSWPVLGREMAGLYTWLLGGGPKPDCVV